MDGTNAFGLLKISVGPDQCEGWKNLPKFNNGEMIHLKTRKYRVENFHLILLFRPILIFGTPEYCNGKQKKKLFSYFRLFFQRKYSVFK